MPSKAAAPWPPPSPLVCEIAASTADRLSAIAAIAAVCARDVGQRLVVRRRSSRPEPSATRADALVTLHLPAALAAAQHPAWCLACRLACFCPDTRVSVLVRCEAAFGGAPGARRSRRRAA